MPAGGFARLVDEAPHLPSTPCRSSAVSLFSARAYLRKETKGQRCVEPHPGVLLRRTRPLADVVAGEPYVLHSCSVGPRRGGHGRSPPPPCARRRIHAVDDRAPASRRRARSAMSFAGTTNSVGVNSAQPLFSTTNTTGSFQIAGQVHRLRESCPGWMRHRRRSDGDAARPASAWR